MLSDYSILWWLECLVSLTTLINIDALTAKILFRGRVAPAPSFWAPDFFGNLPRPSSPRVWARQDADLVLKTVCAHRFRGESSAGQRAVADQLRAGDKHGEGVYGVDGNEKKNANAAASGVSSRTRDAPREHAHVQHNPPSAFCVLLRL